MRFRAVTLNCDNLFIAETSPRSSLDETAVKAKIERLAAVLKRAAGNRQPDVIGLCEIGAASLAQDIGRKVGKKKKEYQSLWEEPPVGPPGRPSTGLAILFDPLVMRHTGKLRIEPTFNEARYHWLAAEFHLRAGSGVSFWVVMNHWSSDYDIGAGFGNTYRQQTAEKLGDFCHHEARLSAEAMLLMGDFNCEPFESPLTGAEGGKTNRIICVREHAWAMNENNELPYFYNPMWRRMGEPIALEATIRPDYNRGAFPAGTHCHDRERQRFRWVTWDQLMVNRRLLIGGPATLVERSIRVTRPTSDTSDHCAIAADFDYH